MFFLVAASFLSSCGNEEANAPVSPPETESTATRSIEEPVEAAAALVKDVQDLAVLDTGEIVLETKAVKPTPRPKAKADNDLFDFGFIDEGDKIKHTFTIRNTGNALLKIRDVEAACGCTVAKLSAMEVAPGKSIIANTVFDSDGKFGNQLKKITIRTNGGKIQLALKGVVRPKGFKPDTTGA